MFLVVIRLDYYMRYSLKDGISENFLIKNTQNLLGY